MTMPSPADIRPPFTQANAAAKVHAAEDGWNSRGPIRVSMAYHDPRRLADRILCYALYTADHLGIIPTMQQNLKPLD